MRTRIVEWLLFWALSQGAAAQQASNLAALHRAGQTFLTWDEAGTGNTTACYQVYRHGAAINADNLPLATLLAQVPPGSSRYKSESDLLRTNAYFIIEDLAAPLATNRGLFVYTPHETAVCFYAVTLRTNGWENTTDFTTGNALTTGVAEAEAEPQPILVRTSVSGRTRVYTQFMDYHRWNPTLGGYAYNYSVALPANYTNTTAYPLHLKLVSRGSRYDDDDTGAWYNRGIQINLDDPDNTWHYGFNDRWDYSKGTHPTNGVIVNFTEQRHLRAFHDVCRDPYYNVDTNRVYAWYSSMGGSGAMTLGFHYPLVFAAVFCWQPVTVYRTAWHWCSQDFEKLWGAVSNNLPIENRGRFAGAITQFNGMGVFDWMDHLAMLTNYPGRHLPLFFFHAGKNDNNIEYATQGAPAIAQFYRGHCGFTAMLDPSAHSGIAYGDWPLAATTNWDIRNLAFRKDSSYPAFSFASGNDPVPPPETPTTNFYNKTLEWSCAWNNFAGDIVDGPTNYEIVLRSGAGIQYADVTIRRPQNFAPTAGAGIVWFNYPLGSTNPLNMGELRVDAYGLATVPRVIVDPAGNRLVLRTDELVDSDDDGLPDWWQLARGLNPTSGTDGASADNDGDYVNNGDEFRAGTHPRDPTSVFRVTGIAGEGLFWQSTPGLAYQLDASQDYINWQTDSTSTVVALETASFIILPNSSNLASQAYRLRLQ